MGTRVSSRRFATRRTGPRVDRVGVLRSRLDAIGRGYLAEGGSFEEWAEALRSVPDIRRPPSAARTTAFRRVVLFGDLVERWHTDPRWLEPDGRPRALPLSGPAGFQGLCREFGHARESGLLARIGLAEEVFVRLGRSRILPRDRSALFRGRLYRDALAVVLTEWHGTLRYNQSPTTSDADQRLERAIYFEKIRRSDEADFHRFVRQQGVAGIKAILTWLHAHRPSKADTDLIEVGVHFVGFTHARQDQSPRGRQSRRV